MGLSELLELANGRQQRFGYAIFRLWDERIAAFQVGSYLKSGTFFKTWTADGWNFRPGFGDVFAVYLCVLSNVFLVWFAYHFVEHLNVFLKTLPGWQKASIFGQGAFQKRCASPRATNVKDRKARRHTAQAANLQFFPAKHCPTLDPNTTIDVLEIYKLIWFDYGYQ